MGESQKQGFRLSFTGLCGSAFQGSRVISYGGLILVGSWTSDLGFGELINQHLPDSRANNTRYSFADLLPKLGATPRMREEMDIRSDARKREYPAPEDSTPAAKQEAKLQAVVRVA